MTQHSPNGSMGVVVTLKSKMAASSASSAGNGTRYSGSVSFDLPKNSNKLPDPLLDGPATFDTLLTPTAQYTFGLRKYCLTSLWIRSIEQQEATNSFFFYFFSLNIYLVYLFIHLFIYCLFILFYFILFFRHRHLPSLLLW